MSVGGQTFATRNCCLWFVGEQFWPLRNIEILISWNMSCKRDHDILFYLTGKPPWNFVLCYTSSWIEIIIRGHLSYKTTFTLTQMWLLNTSLTALWKLSKSNLLVTNFCVLRRQIFGFYRLNWQIFFTCGLYLKCGLYRIPFHSRLCLDRFHCHIIIQCPLSYFDYKYKKECYLVMNQRKLFWYLIIVERL
jgi:hypothetical protein